MQPHIEITSTNSLNRRIIHPSSCQWRRDIGPLGRVSDPDLRELPSEAGQAGGDYALVRVQRGPPQGAPGPGANRQRPGGVPADARGGVSGAASIHGGPIPRGAGSDVQARIPSEGRGKSIGTAQYD